MSEHEVAVSTPVVVCGKYKYTTLLTCPEEARLFLQSRKQLSTAIVTQLFTEHTPESLILDGCSFEEGASEALRKEIAHTMVLTALSLHGVVHGPHFTFSAITTSLVENLSLTTIDLSDCGLCDKDAEKVAKDVVPWNRTVVDWNFSKNHIGDEGAFALAEAFAQSTSSVQRLSFMETGVSNLIRVLKSLASLTCLIQLDVTKNPGTADPQFAAAVDELEHILKQNVRLLYPNANIVEVPLSATEEAQPQPQERTQEQHQTTQQPQNEEAPPPPPSQPSKDTAARKPRQATQRKSVPSTRTTPRQTQPQPASRPQNTPPSKSPESAPPSQPTQSPQPAPSQVQKEEAPAGPPATKEEPPAKQPAPSSSAPKQQPSSSQARPETAPAPSKRASRTASPAPRASPAPQRGASTMVSDAAEGADEWKHIKDRYNQYIRSQSPSAKPMQIYRGMPKYVFGKPLDKVKERKSPAFQLGVVHQRERAPTPAEIRKLAPWNRSNSESRAGEIHRVVVNDGKRQEVIAFFDGGDISYLKDDPREIGFLARKFKEGKRTLNKTSAFASSTSRDMTWSVCDKDATHVPRHAQAPGPGFYTIQSEWDKLAKKREQQRTNSPTGRPLFGTSAALRTVNEGRPKYDMPGPGSYEIP